MRSCACTLMVALGLGPGCGRVGFEQVTDATTDDVLTRCASWAPPVAVPGLEAVIASGPTLTSNLKTMYFDDRTRMYVADRASVLDPFGPPTPLTFTGVQNRGADPEVRADGQLLLFTYSEDLYVAAPVTRDTFQAPVRQTALGALANPQLSEGSAVLRFDPRPGSKTVRATRQNDATPWEVVSDLAELDPSGAVSLTADQLTIVFERAIAAGEFRIFEATRETITDPFGPPILTPGLADVAADEPWISPDGQTLFFSVEVPEMRIWTTTRACP